MLFIALRAHMSRCIYVFSVPMQIVNVLYVIILTSQLIDHLMAGVEDIVGKTGNYNVRDKFKRFDNKFIRPHILKNVQVR